MALTQTINEDWREFLLTRQRLTLCGRLHFTKAYMICQSYCNPPGCPGGLLLLWGFAYFSFFLRLRDLVRTADAETREVKHRALHMPRWDSSAVFGLEEALAKTIS